MTMMQFGTTAIVAALAGLKVPIDDDDYVDNTTQQRTTTTTTSDINAISRDRSSKLCDFLAAFGV